MESLSEDMIVLHEDEDLLPPIKFLSSSAIIKERSPSPPPNMRLSSSGVIQDRSPSPPPLRKRPSKSFIQPDSSPASDYLPRKQKTLAQVQLKKLSRSSEIPFVTMPMKAYANSPPPPPKRVITLTPKELKRKLYEHLRKKMEQEKRFEVLFLLDAFHFKLEFKKSSSHTLKNTLLHLLYRQYISPTAPFPLRAKVVEGWQEEFFKLVEKYKEREPPENAIDEYITEIENIILGKPLSELYREFAVLGVFKAILTERDFAMPQQVR
jgi:hypothetical protein